MSRVRRGAALAAAVLLVPALAATALADDDLRDGVDLSGIGNLNRFITDLRRGH